MDNELKRYGVYTYLHMYRTVSVRTSSCAFSVGEFCLVHLVSSKHPTVFYQHFVECIFFYNSYEKHKGEHHIRIW